MLTLQHVHVYMYVATNSNIEDHYLTCRPVQIGNYLDWKGLLYKFDYVYTKPQILLICDENKEIYVANLMIILIFSWE